MATKQVWTGRVLSGLAVAFMVFDGAYKFTNAEPLRASMAELGYPLGLAPTMGVLGLLCTLLYAIPRTAVLGAILLTGYFGGAVASQLRIGAPLGSHILFPTYLALFVWGGLWLRNERLRALVPLSGEA